MEKVYKRIIYFFIDMNDGTSYISFVNSLFVK